MKSYPVILLFILSLFVSSCTDSITDIGKKILSPSDSIMIGTDTFHLSTKTIFVDSIFSRPDSFLLGTFHDLKFGEIKADILAQVNCPVGFKFPANSAVDSAKISVIYYTCFGDTLSPLDLNIYEMNKQTFSYMGLYASNLNPLDYSDRSIKLGERIIRAGQNSSVAKVINFKLDTSSDFVKRLGKDSYFSSTSTFLTAFKGIYITANFGASTLLNVGLINLRYFYHYTYPTKNINGGDSIATVNDYITFPANSEVRQVNRIEHPDRKTVVQPLEGLNYIASPANLQTQVGVPLKKIHDKLEAGINGKKLTINSAMLRVDVAETDQDTVSHPVVKYLMVIKESAIDRFFNNKELPSDTCSVAVGISSEEIGTTGTYRYFYSFNISKLIANELKLANTKKINPVDNLNLRLIPVSIGTTTSSSGTVSVTSVKQEFLMQAITIQSGKNTTSPMRINMVYSGF